MKKGVWGWLCPLRNEFESLELKKDEYTVGRDSGCSYVITETQLDRFDYSTLSKKQFKILKKKDGVYLENIGGTYINNKEIKPGEKVILNHNDSISIARMYIKVFVYLDRSCSEASSSSLPVNIGQKFHISYKLGQGGFGEVMLVFDKETGKRFAMKSVNKKPSILKYTRTEAEILSKIQHPCIIMTREVVDTRSTLFIVMEMMDGGDLLRRVRDLTEANTKLIFFQLVQAIQHLHQHNIVHRDIKPENVLLASRSNETLIKVTDFGVSKILKPGTVMDTEVGTPLYVAPEIKKNLQHSEYTKQVDVWSMGVLLYYCLSGTLPFSGSAQSYFLTFTSYKWKQISSNAVTLIKSMLQVQPAVRIGVEDILANSWLKDETMRRRAHQLMWPGKPYKAVAASPALPLALRRKSSLPEQTNRFEARGVLQFMSNRAKPALPLAASQPQLVRANVNHQPVKQNAVYPPRQALANPLEKPSRSPIEKKPNAFSPLQRNEARVLPQIQKFEPKFNASPAAKQPNISPLQQKYQAKPYVSPFNKISSTALSQPKPNIKPSASPVDKKPPPLSPLVKNLKPPASPLQKKFEAKPYGSPVERKLFPSPNEERKNPADWKFAFNKK